MRSWTTRTFQINFSRSMASFFLVPLAKIYISHQIPTFPQLHQQCHPLKYHAFPMGSTPPPKNHSFVSLQLHNNDEVLDVFGVAANVRGSAYIISSRSASLKHRQRMRLWPMTHIPNSGRTRLKAAGSQAHRSSGSEISGHHLHRGDRQKFSRGAGVPC